MAPVRGVFRPGHGDANCRGTWLFPRPVVDEKLGTQFLGIVGLLLGIASGFVQLVTKALRDAKSSER